MTEYKALEKARGLKQFFASIVFLAVLAAAWRYPLLGYFIPFCMLLGIGISLFNGRKWCDWLCPRGSFFDSLIKPVSPGKKIPNVFKGLALRIGMLSFLMALMTVQLVRLWPDPYKIGAFFVTLLTVTTILGIVLALIFHQRAWCCFCPIGTMANWIGRRRYRLKIDSASCNGCRLCGKACPIRITPYAFRKEGVETVKDGDCLRCGLCVSACPGKALSL